MRTRFGLRADIAHDHDTYAGVTGAPRECSRCPQSACCCAAESLLAARQKETAMIEATTNTADAASGKTKEEPCRGYGSSKVVG